MTRGSSGMNVFLFQLYDGDVSVEMELLVFFLRRLLFCFCIRALSIWNMEGLSLGPSMRRSLGLSGRSTIALRCSVSMHKPDIRIVSQVGVGLVVLAEVGENVLGMEDCAVGLMVQKSNVWWREVGFVQGKENKAGSM